MKSPILYVEDNFFQDGEAARKAVLSTPFKDVVSHVDGITYPDINLEIPAWVQMEIIQGIERVQGFRINPKFLFARAMIKDRPVPNKVHSDFNMGDFSALIYLSPKWPEYAGTGFFKHRTQGFQGTAKTDWSQIDHNTMENWERYALAVAKFNRLVIHDAKAWHMAEPNNAWGTGPEDGRLVITVFYDRKWL